jgi:E3 ubiquitin-protein ligase TRIP12
MGETLPLDLATLRQVDPNFARTMEKFQEIIEQKLAIQNDEALSEADKTERILALRLDGAKLEDLGLDFVLPGDPSIELRVSLAGFYCENTIADDTRFIIPG